MFQNDTGYQPDLLTDYNPNDTIFDGNSFMTQGTEEENEHGFDTPMDNYNSNRFSNLSSLPRQEKTNFENFSKIRPVSRSNQSEVEEEIKSRNDLLSGWHLRATLGNLENPNSRKTLSRNASANLNFKNLNS